MTVVPVMAAAAEPPIAGGEARYVENPVPDTVEDAERVVKLPAAAAEPPMAGGEARYVLKPVPETVEEAERVVAATVPAVVGPRLTALRLVTVAPSDTAVAPKVMVLLASAKLGTAS